MTDRVIKYLVMTSLNCCFKRPQKIICNGVCKTQYCKLLFLVNTTCHTQIYFPKVRTLQLGLNRIVIAIISNFSRTICLLKKN